jgi:hypothetical protein
MPDELGSGATLLQDKDFIAAKDANDVRPIQSRNIFASLKNKIVQI